MTSFLPSAFRSAIQLTPLSRPTAVGGGPLGKKLHEETGGIHRKEEEQKEDKKKVREETEQARHKETE